MTTSPRAMSRDHAVALAAEAVRFLAADEQRIERFMALSGADPETIRASLADDAFLAGVLDHMLQDESLLLAFAETAGLDPDDPARAHHVLGGVAYE